MIKDKPLFGHGYNSFGLFQKDYQADYFLDNISDNANAYLSDNVNFAFNEYLQIASETGIVGLVLFLGIIISVLFSFIKLRSTEKRVRHLHLISLVGIISILISGLFSYPLHSVPIVIVFIIYISIISRHSLPVYSIKIKPVIYKPAAICLVAISVILLSTQVKRWSGEQAWFDALQTIKTGDKDQALAEYQRIYPVMKYNAHFLFNYGAELSVLAKYVESNEILEEAEKRLNHTDLLVYKGINYESLNETQKAIESFNKAALIVPHKLYPKYRLFALYHNLGDFNKAKEMAKDIMKTDVKIENQISKSIKEQADKYITQNL
jgi:HEPN domain-containing protein